VTTDPVSAGGTSTREGNRLAGLARLARALVPARTVVQVAEVAAHEARFAFDARVAAVGRFELERGVLRVLVTAGDLASGEQARPSDDVRTLREHPPLATLAADAAPWVASLDDPVLSPAARQDLASDDSHSALGVPIVHDGIVWGALLVRRAGGAPAFVPADLDFAVAFAGLVSAGLGQVEHVARVRRLAYSDPLTGLGNRRLIEERLERILGAPDHRLGRDGRRQRTQGRQRRLHPCPGGRRATGGRRGVVSGRRAALWVAGRSDRR
jgi:GAF domain-containing protein